MDVGASAGPGGLQVTSQARAQQTTGVPSSRPASRALGMVMRATQPGTDELLRKPFKPPTIVNPDAKFLRECISRGSQITRPGTSGGANPSNQGKAKDATRQRHDQDDESNSKPFNRISTETVIVNVVPPITFAFILPLLDD